MDLPTRRAKNIYPRTIHKDELAAWVGLDPVRIWQLANTGKIPTAVRGMFPFEDSIKAIFRYYREGRRESRAEAGEASRRKEEASAELAEIAVKERYGELVNVEELATMMRKPLDRMKQAVMSSPNLTQSQKAELLTELQALYKSIFKEPITSPRLEKLAKAKV